MALNEKGVKISRSVKPAVQKELDVPDEFLKALQHDQSALSVFGKFSPSDKKST